MVKWTSRFKITDLIAFIIMFIIGFGLLAINLYSVSQYEPVLWKPTTTGTIIVSKVVMERTGAGEQRESLYYPVLSFSYSVDGERYRKNAVERQGQMIFRDAEDAKKIIEKYPVGTSVPVYFRPGSPENGIFQSGIGTKFNATRTMLIIAAIGLLIVSGIVYALRRSNSFTIDPEKIPSTVPLLPKVDDLPPY